MDGMIVDVVSIVAVLTGGLLVALGMVCWTVVALFRPKRNAAGTADETRIMQELFEGLQRMENRVESLETLLIDQEQKRRSRRGNENS